MAVSLEDIKSTVTNASEVIQLRDRYQMGERLLERASVFKTSHRTQGMARIEKQIKAEMAMIEKVPKCNAENYELLCIVAFIVIIWFASY